MEEAVDDSQKLIMNLDNDMWSDTLKQKKTRSANLLKKELAIQGKTGSREFLIKVRIALLGEMRIMYRRKDY